MQRNAWRSFGSARRAVVALRQYFGEDWTGRTRDERAAILEDVHAMVEDENLYTWDAVVELRRRIGGAEQLGYYSHCLLVEAGKPSVARFDW